MSRIILICLFYLPISACYDNSDIVDLAIKKERFKLIEKGWLSEAFLYIDITSGKEIHNIDTNIVWGYFESKDMNVKENCKVHPFKNLSYNLPPKKIRTHWVSSNQFKNMIKYQCIEFGVNFVFLYANNITYFTNSTFPPQIYE